MPPASRMASLLVLLSAARFCSVPSAVTAEAFSGLVDTWTPALLLTGNPKFKKRTLHTLR